MKRRLLSVLVALLIAPMTVHAVLVGGIEVSDPGASVGSRTVGEYTALWWKYVLETPQAVNPFLDQSGNLFAPGPYTANGVTFLYGAPQAKPAMPVTRMISVAAGTNLLVPLIQWVNLKTDPAETAQDLLDQIAPQVAGTSGLFAQVNGVDFSTQTGRNLLDYREMFGLPGDHTFGVSFPAADALFGLDGFSTDVIVADGHWLLLRNLPLGEQTLRFGGINAAGDSVDVTYKFNVVPEPSTLALLGLGLASLGLACCKARRSPESS